MNIFLYLVQSTICLTFFYAFYLFALQKETTFQLNRLYLLSTLIISISLPFVKFYIDAPDTQPIVTASQVVIGPYLDSFENIVITAGHKESISWLNVFFWAYLAGVLLFSTRFFIELWNLIKIKNAGQHLKISGSDCVLSDSVKSPFSFFGTIFLPLDHKFKEGELSEVIRHEQTHIEGRHSIDILVMELAGIALWMNPVIHLYRRKLRELHEFLADAAVLKHSDWEQYAQFLLSQKNHGLQHQLSNQLVYSQLKNRIIMMTQKRSTFFSRVKYLGIIPILLIASIMFAFREKPGAINNIVSSFSSDTLPRVEINAYSLPNSESEKEGTENLYDSREVFTYVEKMPRFGDCEPNSQKEWVKCNSEALYNFINKTISYPAEARKNGIQGMVLIQFIIEADGEMSNIKIIRGVSPELDKEALRVVNLMNEHPQKWIPGYNNGKPVAVIFTLPITFKLDENKIDTLPRNDVFTHVEQMPRFPGCEHLSENERVDCSTREMFQFIYEAVNYPKVDREKGNEGLVILQFIVEADGSISNAKIVRGVSEGLDNEALRVIKSMNDLKGKWIPGMKDGQPVSVQFTLPFKFVLQSDQVTENISPSSFSESPVRIGFDKPKKEETLSNGQLYPNPTNISINIETFKGAHTFKIFDLSGKLHITQQIPKSDFSATHNIDISRLKAGQYVLHIVSDNETKTMQFGVVW